MTIWTIKTILDWTTQFFTQNQLTSPRLDAELLLAHHLQMKRLQLYLNYDRPLDEHERTHFKKIIQRRVRGEPVAYLTGYKEFWSLDFKVGPGVLIPRPDTEILIEYLVKWSKTKSHSNLKILDVGTGSGNIAISLAKELPQAKITAIDQSYEALTYARYNAKYHQVDDRIQFLEGNFFDVVNQFSDFHILVSNPPYIPIQTISKLTKDIKDFEPDLALNGGEDGLDFYSKIKDCLPSILDHHGVVALEIGEEQANSVVNLLKSAGFNRVNFFKDYGGLPRMVMGEFV